METIAGIFWNREERRLRALWRLLLQVALLLLFLLPLQFAIGIVALFMFAAQQGLTLDQLSDPQLSMALQQYIAETPAVAMLSMLTTLVAMVLSIWLAGRFLDRRPFAGFGLHLNRNWWLDFAFGLFLGALLMTVIFLVELAAGWVTVTGTFVTRDPGVLFPVALLPPLLTFLAVGFYEELFSRGYQLQNMAEGLNGRLLGPRWAIVLATLLSTLIFGLLHATNPNASTISTLNLFVGGIFLLSLGYVLTGELAIPIGIHITWNFFQGNVFGFPVSGGDFRSATFIAVEQGGPELLTGGAFGPEAGLLGLAMMLLAGLLIALWVRWRYGRVSLHLPLAEPPVVWPAVEV